VPTNAPFELIKLRNVVHEIDEVERKPMHNSDKK
jgi:hypothetical protein